MRGVASLGGITFDAVQSPFGEYAEQVLGGNAAYGAWGASLWVGPGESYIVGCVGGDFPAAWVHALAEAGMVTSGLKTVAGVATSLWQAAYSDVDQRRNTEPSDTPRSDPDDLEPRLSADDELWADIGAVHCAPVAPSTLLHNLAALQERSVTVVVDPGEESEGWSAEVEAHVLSRADVYCPSLDELPEAARTDPAQAAAHLAERGPATVVVKLGSRGSVVYSEGRSMFIPAAPAHVVDPTGAGDSYCGAFAAAVLRFGDPFIAGVLATATASIAVEHSGLIDCLGVDAARVRERATTIAAVTRLHLPALT